MTEQRPNDERFSDQLDRLRSRWPQAWISAHPNVNGEYLVCCPTWHLPVGWNKTICSVLWLVRLDEMHRNRRQPTCVASPLNGFYVDLDDIRLADGRIAKNSRPFYSRSKGRERYVFQRDTWEGESIPGFDHWTDVTRFWWVAQMWNPNTDNLYTHAMLIKRRLEILQ